MNNMRLTSKEWNGIETHPDFEIVEPGEENVLVVGFGGRAGRVLTDKKEYSRMKPGCAGVYIRATEEILERIQQMEPELLSVSNRYSRMKHCYQVDVIGVYDKKYGRPNLLMDSSHV